nr:DUF4189 domain-containing protein [Gammaproteobacteria bacterium]
MFYRIRTITAKCSFALTIALFGSQAMAAGALAIDSNQGRGYGFAHGYQNTSQAEQRALNECGHGCQVVLRFNSGCAAYAADQSSGSTAYGWGTASSGSAAQNRALSECQSRGGSSCMVRSWACD